MALPLGNSRSSGGAKNIVKRRQREEQLASHAQNVIGMRSMNLRAEWEDRLHEDSKKRQVTQVFQLLQNQDETELYHKKKRLADLYNREIEQWRQELVERVETPEQRKQKMIERAKALKQRREAQRLEVVREKRMQQYRNACDDVRSIDSQRALDEAVAVREQQVEERKQILREEEEFEQRMAQLWDEDRKKKIQREEQVMERIKNQNAETKKILDLQVDLSKKRMQQEEETRKREEQELLKLWKKQAEIEVAREMKRRMDEVQRAAEVKMFNKERANLQQIEQAKELEYDMQLLELALQHEAEAEEKEKALQEKFKREQIEYKEMLRKQMEIEAEDLSYLDEIRSRMENEVWEKRDAQHNAEAAARRELLRQVLNSREEQIALKKKIRMHQKEEDLRYIQRAQKDGEDALMKEVEEQHNRFKQCKENQVMIRDQMAHRRQQHDKYLQEQALEAKRMQYEEREHNKRVQFITQQNPIKSHRRKTAEWFFDS